MDSIGSQFELVHKSTIKLNTSMHIPTAYMRKSKAVLNENNILRERKRIGATLICQLYKMNYMMLNHHSPQKFKWLGTDQLTIS